MMICKNDLCALLDKSLLYVLGEKVDDLELVFNKAIGNDYQEYSTFARALNTVKEILKEMIIIILILLSVYPVLLLFVLVLFLHFFLFTFIIMVYYHNMLFLLL